MSAAWRLPIVQLRHPCGPCDALGALMRWVSLTPGLERLRSIVHCSDTEQGGQVIADALVGGGWNGQGIDELQALLCSNDGRALLETVLIDARERRWRRSAEVQQAMDAVVAGAELRAACASAGCSVARVRDALARERIDVASARLAGA